MIVPMRKVHIVARQRDQDRLLERLRDLGVVHLEPVDRARAVADEETVAAIARLGRAVQVLREVIPAGEPPALGPVEAAAEVLRIQHDSVERNHRLASLHQQWAQTALWGDVRLKQFADLRKAGLEVRFSAVPRRQVGEIQAECVEPICPWPGKRILVAVIRRGGEPEVPEGSEPIPLPERDRPSLRAEAAEIDAALKADAAQLGRLAHRTAAMEAERARLKEKARWTIAERSALADERLYALQGWVPEPAVPALPRRLAEAGGRGGLEAAVQAFPPEPDEAPPTLIRYPWWARPMEGLFKILGTVPGYGEFDVSAMFMIFLPTFAAILISDAGYGLLYVLLPAIFYRKMAAKGLAPLAQLVIVIGVLAMVWGVLTASFFGFSLCEWPLVGRLMPHPLVAVNMKKESMDWLMWFSVTLGAIHLSLAHLWKAKAAFPSLRALSELGWAVWFFGMYGLVKMFLLKTPFALHEFPYYPWWLIVGGGLAILFAAPDKNPLKMLGLGLAHFPLSAIGTFGDTVSYVRLMAIGLAGSALAIAFNDMGARLPWFATIPIIMAGHAMNISLSIISLFAHGVRLNMLEFSNNLGMQWSGYAYEPFSKSCSQET